MHRDGSEWIQRCPSFYQLTAHGSLKAVSAGRHYVSLGVVGAVIIRRGSIKMFQSSQPERRRAMKSMTSLTYAEEWLECPSLSDSHRIRCHDIVILVAISVVPSSQVSSFHSYCGFCSLFVEELTAL